MGHGHEILFHSDTRSEADPSHTGFLIDIDDIQILLRVLYSSTWICSQNPREESYTGRNVKYHDQNCVSLI